MPFNLKKYRDKIRGESRYPWGKLVADKRKYNSQMSVAYIGSLVAIIGAPFSGGLSLLELAITGAQLSNADRKRTLIDAEMRSRGNDSSTRKRDLALGGGISLATAGAGHAVSHVATTALLSALSSSGPVTGAVGQTYGAGYGQVMQHSVNRAMEQTTMSGVVACLQRAIRRHLFQCKQVPPAYSGSWTATAQVGWCLERTMPDSHLQ